MKNKTDYFKIILSAFTSLFLLFIIPDTAKSQTNYDVVIYGGTSAGIAAAIQCSRMGKSVLLIEPSRRVGGLTTGGLGQTDIGNKQAIGGISREFYQNIKKYYDDPSNWEWQTRDEYRDGGQTRTKTGEDAMWTFEPSAALKVYKKMIAAENIDLVYEERLNRENGVIKSGAKITEIKMENGKSYKGKMFIDATYEGDLIEVLVVGLVYLIVMLIVTPVLYLFSFAFAPLGVVIGRFIRGRVGGRTTEQQPVTQETPVIPSTPVEDEPGEIMDTAET